jgi:VWFA-related protein
MRGSAFAVSLLLITPMLGAQSVTPAASSQPADQDTIDRGTITLKQEVRNVVVDVVVTDKHGHPVKSLQKGRFEVLENGVPQDIAFFEEHSASDQAAAPARQAAVELPANVHTNVEAAPANGPLMVLLLDALNTRPDQQSYVRAQVIEYLKHLAPGTQMAIFTLGNNLQMIQGFTSDPAVLRAALDGRSYPTVTTLSPGGVMSGEGIDPSAGSVIPFSRSVQAVRAGLERFGNNPRGLDQELRIRYTLDALNAMGVYLAGIQGRKNLIWFAGSVPWTINPDFSLVTDVTGRVDYSNDLKQLANVMTTGRISIYPVDAEALPPAAGYGADYEGSSFAVRGNGDAFGRQEMNSQMFAAGDHMSMENLATATGGQAQFNTNGLADAVAKVHAIAENYYTLAYSPRDKNYDGGLRQVEIRVSDPGVKLEYRRGYYADDPARTAKRTQVVYSNPLRAVMQRGAPDATQIPFQVEAQQAAEQPDAARPLDRIGNDAEKLHGPVVRYDFHWNVDLSGIDFTSTPNGRHRAEVDAVLDAYDADGKILNSTYAVLPLNLDDAQYARFLKSGLPMKQTLDVPAGQVYLRAGLLDPHTGYTGATEFALTVKPSL